ncbi:DUF3949 domain-containing protein [Thalassobacillus hwangdonensis]|uniref:DUF3949 domain-containing protein n=1 Tax=Thalassobacillus hwangdonensis TaxID=546108 RepID=A0ABW3L3G3_9BACI
MNNLTTIILIIVGIYLLINAIMTPIQYRYYQGMSEEQKRKGKSKQEYYEDMSFQEEQMHFFNQSSILFLPASITAYTIYKLRKNK